MLDSDAKSFQQAVESKYGAGEAVERRARAEGDNETSRADTTSRFYRTEGNFDVEVVLSDKVAARFHDLSRLREIGLEYEGLAKACDLERPGASDELDAFGMNLAGE